MKKKTVHTAILMRWNITSLKVKLRRIGQEAVGCHSEAKPEAELFGKVAQSRGGRLY